MKLNYKPNSQLEKFGIKIYNLLVENFPQTFFVGGMVRDFLLHRTIQDIDLATSARPEEVVKILDQAGIKHDDKGKTFGVIKALAGSREAEIATFRKDSYANSRYPKIAFVTSAKIDSQRRDFSINSLYFSPKTSKILNFHKGQRDLEAKLVRFIGQPEKRIKQDPLRILRALRFAWDLKFLLESRTRKAIRQNLYLINRLTKTRSATEIKKISSANNRRLAKKMFVDPKTLDNLF